MDSQNPLFKKFLRNQKKSVSLEKVGERQLQFGKQKLNLAILKEF